MCGEAKWRDKNYTVIFLFTGYADDCDTVTFLQSALPTQIASPFPIFPQGGDWFESITYMPGDAGLADRGRHRFHLILSHQNLNNTIKLEQLVWRRSSQDPKNRVQIRAN